MSLTSPFISYRSYLWQRLSLFSSSYQICKLHAIKNRVRILENKAPKFLANDRLNWRNQIISLLWINRKHYLTQPILTSERRKDVKRGDFSKLTSADIEYFRSILKESSQIISDADQLEVYNADWLHTCRGASELVLRPKTTEEVSRILRYCNDRKLAVNTQGGNTGLVGGGVPVFDEIILSTSLMNNITSIDPITGVLTCQSGCILEQLDESVAKHDLVMPLDLGAKGTCQIGGNVSTNAGGIRLLRFGSLHGSVLGIEAVLASGEIVNTLSSVRKDNVGYHLKHLFVGSEGTLAVVTAVSILCPKRSSSVNVCFLGCDSFEKVLLIMKSARQHLNEILSAYEIIDKSSLEYSIHHLKMLSPLQENCPFYVLIETSGSDKNHDEEKLNGFLESLSNEGLVMDGTLATDTSKIKKLWLIRESITFGLRDDGYCYKYDISLPLDSYYEIVNVMREQLKDLALRVCGYGHVMDGNLHLNVTTKEYDERVVKLIQPFLFEYISERGGSISAEHGLGFMKNNYIHYGRSQQVVQLMMNMKNMMDPNGILNPYKTLPLQKH